MLNDPQTYRGGQLDTKGWVLTQVTHGQTGNRKHCLPQFRDRNWNSSGDVWRSLKNWATEMRTEIFLFLSHSSVPQSQDHPSSFTLTPREKDVIPICLPSSSPIIRLSIFLSVQGTSKHSLKQKRPMRACLPAGDTWHSWCALERLLDSCGTLRFHASWCRWRQGEFSARSPSD